MKSAHKIIIFDIGDTLTQASKFRSFTYFGSLSKISYIFNYFTKNRKINFQNFKKNLTNFYINYLEKIPSKYSHENEEFRTINGKPMPALQRDYLLGKISSQECLEIGQNWIQKNKLMFSTKSEYEIFKKIFEFNFNPEIFIKNQNPTKCMDLLKKCYNKKNLDGKRTNYVIILSNMPKDIIPLFKKYFPEIYQYSDLQLFSCEQGLLKPNKDLFKICLSYCPDNEQIFYIDDEVYQRETAQKLGIKVIDPSNAEIVLKNFEVI